MATQETMQKPSYLGLLNTISLAESNAGVYLTAWADATDDEELAGTLRFVAARESSHGEVFCRRLCELGFELRHKADPGADKRLAKYANPKICDLDKIGADVDTGEDPFAEVKKQLADGVYDPMTANLMSWYIAEEYDSGARLRKAYAKVRNKTAGRSDGMAAGPNAETEALMACMTAGFTRMEKALEKLAKAVK